MSRMETGTTELPRSVDETAWRDFWLTTVAQERAERSFQWKQGGVKVASEYAAKEQATRPLHCQATHRAVGARSSEWQSVTRRTPRQCKQKTIGLPLSPQADSAGLRPPATRCRLAMSLAGVGL